MHILFLHGALASKAQFDSLIALLPKEITSHTLDFSGHGSKVLMIGSLSLNQFVKDIEDYVKINKLSEFHLFGYSLGGYVALLYASLHPEKVKSILCLNVKYNWDIETTLREIKFLNPDNILDKVPSFANHLIFQHGINMWKGLVEQTSQFMLSMTQNTLLSDEILQSIQISCRLAIGENDTTSSLDETIRIKNLIPNSSLLVIPNTPHPFEKISLPRLLFEIKDYYQY